MLCAEASGWVKVLRLWFVSAQHKGRLFVSLLQVIVMSTQLF